MVEREMVFLNNSSLVKELRFIKDHLNIMYIFNCFIFLTLQVKFKNNKNKS